MKEIVGQKYEGFSMDIRLGCVRSCDIFVNFINSLKEEEDLQQYITAMNESNGMGTK